MNLVSLIKQFLTPDIINRISTALGLDRYTTQTAIGAAVPGLLAGLLGVASQPGGAQRVADAVNQQSSSGVLGTFTSMLGGSGQSSLIDKGSQLLGSLFGGSGQNALTGAIGKYAGLGQGESSSLLGMLAPLVMGTIAQSQGSRPFDASSISTLLTSQKNNIASAMPSGFGNLLSGTGIFDSITGAVTGAARKAGATATEGMRTAAYAARETAEDVGDAGRRAASAIESDISAMPNWLYWAIPLLALTALAIFLFMRPAERGVNRASAVPTIMMDRTNVALQLSDSVTGLHATLADIQDGATARAALPMLQQLDAQIGEVDAQRQRMTAEQRRAVAGIVNPSLPALTQSFDRVLALPDAPPELKPTVDALRAKLAAIGA